MRSTLLVLSLTSWSQAQAFMGSTVDGTYQWSTSAQPSDADAPVHAFVSQVDLELAASTVTHLDLGDDTASTLSLGGAFTFYDNAPVSEIQVCANGHIVLVEPLNPGTADIDCHYDPPETLGDSGLPNAFIAALWVDLDPSHGGSVTAYEDASGVTIHWEAVPQYDDPLSLPPLPVTMQVRLNYDSEDGPRSFWIAYEDVGVMTQSNREEPQPLTGIEDATGTNEALVLQHPAPEILSNTTVVFERCPSSGCAFCVDPEQMGYRDEDTDGVGGASLTTCHDPTPLGYALLPGGDCDDDDPTAYPGNHEICDGIDNDCLLGIDDGFPTDPYYRDFDNDDYGDLLIATTCAANQPTGTVLDNTDCDDDDPTSYPFATEVCDGADNDCNLTIDDGLLIAQFVDGDHDGFGNPLHPADACPGVPGFSVVGTDCDDEDSAVNPDAVDDTCDEVDDDCDHVVDEHAPDLVLYPDLDDDGFGDATPLSTQSCVVLPHTSDNDLDCDDADAHINPHALEICDGIDNDCDGHDDLALQPWFPDVDEDGFGSGVSVQSCDPVPGHVPNDLDCDDGDETLNPHAEEVCDTVDNDCDLLIDEDDDDLTHIPTWYVDQDGDTFGEDGSGVQSCTQPAQTANRDGDCDDDDPDIFLGAPEACADLVDNDCDELIDAHDPDFQADGVDYARDLDGDGFGDPAAVQVACAGFQPADYVPLSLGEDCDDATPTVYPFANEVCDLLDNDCNGAVDDGLVRQDYFRDADGDLYGDPTASPISACVQPLTYVSNGLDCDDADPHRHPNRAEICDGMDQDCDLEIDETVPTEDYYPDEDGDGFGDSSAEPETSCSVVEDKITDGRDCDDTDPEVNPDAVDDPDDGFDANCDGVEENVPPPPVLPDTDGDGVVDSIDGDPLSAGSAETVAPPEPAYGCGCTTERGTFGWLRRR